MPELIPRSPTEADYARGAPGPAEDLFLREEPFDLFSEWLEEAGRTEPNDPNAMTLATVDGNGMPDARQVLLKDFDGRGFTFFTNLDSAKGSQLAERPLAALLFHWKSLRRQVRVRGGVEPVASEEADAYFATRARDSQIGAWASDQSRPMPEPQDLTRRMVEYGQKFSDAALPRPPRWSGFRVAPLRIEFWRDRPFRLHDRLTFERADTRSDWSRARLYP